jgi:hypothetical protein
MDGDHGAVSEAKRKIAEKNRKKAVREGKAPPPLPPPKHHYLLPRNRLAWDVYLACRTQLVSVGMGGVVALNHGVWDFEFEMHDVPAGRRREVYRKLRVLEEFWIARLNRKDTTTTEPPGPKGRGKR